MYRIFNAAGYIIYIMCQKKCRSNRTNCSFERYKIRKKTDRRN